MGVLGLVSFVKQKAGHTITTQRLSQLAGKTVTVDGNLLTLKFFHSPTYTQPSALVLNWYRFIRNLQSYDIRPIIVFDGKARVSAKARELERRQAARKLLGGRAKSEKDRVKRLSSLKEVIGELQALDHVDRTRFLNETQRILEEQTAITTQDLQEKTEKILDPDLPLSDRLAGLVLESQAAKLSEEGSLSKRQLDTAQNEAKAFMQAIAVQADVAVTLEGEVEVEDPLQALESVLQESTSIATSYKKRASSPSRRALSDCMGLIRAMGIPLLLTSDTVPQEAESLCASLVLANRADTVLSEDTDVLVYQAPLLRRINSVSRDGEHIDGADVRIALGLGEKQWLDFCILCGCDFAERLRGMGPTTAYKLVAKYGSIDDILASKKLPKHVSAPPDLGTYMLEVAAARNVFASPVPSEEIDTAKLQARTEDPQLLAVLRGLGVELEKDDLLAYIGYKEDDSYTLDHEEGTSSLGFGLASLGDSPLIPDGTYEPAPGGSLLKAEEADIKVRD